MAVPHFGVRVSLEGQDRNHQALCEEPQEGGRGEQAEDAGTPEHGDPEDYEGNTVQTPCHRLEDDVREPALGSLLIHFW